MVVVLFLILTLATPAFAVQYYVDNTNGSASNSNAGTDSALPWLTMAKAASTLVAGDTVIVLAGSYDERVSPTNSGTSGSRITYQSSSGAYIVGGPKIRSFTISGKNYITLQGLELTSSGFSADASANILASGDIGVWIINNYIHDTSTTAVRFSSSNAKSTSLIIRGNSIVRAGTTSPFAIGIQMFADESLIDNNDISSVSDFTNIFGSRNVLRNNHFHDSGGGTVHVDGMQTFCNTAPSPETARYLLIEGNNYENNPGSDEHFTIANGTASCGNAKNIVVRFNRIYQVGSFSIEYDDSSGADSYHKFYNNTIVQGGVGVSPKTNAYSSTLSGSTNATLKNNIYVDSCRATSGTTSIYGLKSGDSTSTGDYNLAYFTTGSITFASPINAETHKILNQDPLFFGAADFSLVGTSPAVGAAGPLTTVAAGDSGSGTSLVVADAGFFQPGWAGTKGDEIAISTVNNRATIIAIDYATNTLTISSTTSRSVGDSIWLAKDSSGHVKLFGAGPEMGAFEFGLPGNNVRRRGFTH